MRLVAPLLIYLAITFACYWRNVSWSDYYFGYATDSLLFIWSLNWWPFALTHGLNPFICKYLWYPVGYNFTWATSVPFFALLCWPITVLGSPVLSYNILMLSAPALAAWTAFLLARELTGNWTASLVGGFLFGFCPAELSQFTTQLNLSCLFPIPLAALLCIRRLHGRLGRWPFIVSFSLLLVMYLGISTELLATLCIAGALAWGIFLAFAPPDERAAFWRLAAEIGLAAPLTMLLAAPFLYYLITGLPDVPKFIHPLLFQITDLLQTFLPTLPIHSAGDLFAAIKQQFSGFSPAQFGYITLPLLLILIAYFGFHRSTAYAKALLAFGCAALLLSLGFGLSVNMHYTGIPLPWAMFTHIPVLRAIMPARFFIYVSLASAMAAALWLAGAKTRRARGLRFALGGLACLVVLPARVTVLPAQWTTQQILMPQYEFKWTRWPTQPFFTPAHINQALGHLPNVMLLPDPAFGPGMAWQIDAGMSFTQATGYAGFKLVPELQWDVLDDTDTGRPKPGFNTAFRAFCVAHRVDYILIGPGTPTGLVRAIEALGWPHHMDEGIEVVKRTGDAP